MVFIDLPNFFFIPRQHEAVWPQGIKVPDWNRVFIPIQAREVEFALPDKSGIHVTRLYRTGNYCVRFAWQNTWQDH